MLPVLLYTNDSDKPFWGFIRNEHHSLIVPFECKNTSKVDIEDINQVAGYLGDALGYLGIILTRQALPDDRRFKCFAWYNKGVPHRVIIALSDQDIKRMLQMRSVGNNPLEILRYRYQEFLTKVQ